MEAPFKERLFTSQYDYLLHYEDIARLHLTALL
jgi:hypothetical protein